MGQTVYRAIMFRLVAHRVSLCGAWYQFDSFGPCLNTKGRFRNLAPTGSLCEPPAGV